MPDYYPIETLKWHNVSLPFFSERYAFQGSKWFATFLGRRSVDRKGTVADAWKIEPVPPFEQMRLIQAAVPWLNLDEEYPHETMMFWRVHKR